MTLFGNRSARQATRRDPPHLWGYPLVGVLPQLLRDPLRYVSEVAAKHGGIVSLQIGPIPVYLLTHPGYARHVLEESRDNYVKDLATRQVRAFAGDPLFALEDDAWRRRRDLVAHAHDPQLLAGLVATMVDATATLLKRWRTTAEGGVPIDITAELHMLMDEIAIRTIFGPLPASDMAALRQTMHAIVHWTENRVLEILRSPLTLLAPVTPRLRRELNNADAIISRVCKHCRQQGETASLIGLLVRASDLQSGANDRQVRDEVMMAWLQIAQQIPTALAWICHALATHPQAQEWLRIEASEVLGGRTPAPADLSRLCYTAMAVKESLRLYPTNWAIVRASRRADTIGGYHIRANAGVVVGTYTIHRRPDLWERPEAFEPERFAPERASEHVPYAYHPFGAVPRGCLGQHYAMTALSLITAMIFQSFQLNPAPRHSAEPSARLVLLHPRNGVKISLEQLPVASR
jgi:cytochrome P450